MKKMVLLFIVAWYILGRFSGLAVIIRHDVPDNHYKKFARAKHLQAGWVVTRPWAPVPGSGVVIEKKYILTAGHIGSNEGPVSMPVKVMGKEYLVEYVFIYPTYNTQTLGSSGDDLSIWRIKGTGISEVVPAKIWTGGIRQWEMIHGVGQGRSGTGHTNNEPWPAGTFRGYQNIVDVILPERYYHLLVADFDGPSNSGNSLATDIYFLQRKISGNSSGEPLFLEGSVASGDSGSGIWIERNQKYYLAGIATGRYYASYYAQSLYVNLSDPRIAAWIKKIVPHVQTVR